MIKSKLLKASLITLVAPALFAYGSDGEAKSSMSNGFSVGAEIQGHLVNVGWHPKGTGKTLQLAKMTMARDNHSAWVYQDGNDKQNYTFGGRVTGKTAFSDDFTFMLAVGFEAGMQDGKGYRPVNQGTGTAGDTAVTTANWDLQDTTGVATWKNNMVLSPAVFLGYGALSLGVSYDMREYQVSGHETGHTTYLNKTIKDNQVMFGFRGEQCYDMDDMKLVVSFEFMSNLGAKADSDTDTYFKDLAKYDVDQLIAAVSTNAISAGEILFHETESYIAPANRGSVSSVHTNITKASFGIGVQFVEF